MQKYSGKNFDLRKWRNDRFYPCLSAVASAAHFWAFTAYFPAFSAYIYRNFTLCVK